MYANDKEIIQTNAAKLKPVIAIDQPISIIAANAMITVKYGPYPSVTAAVFDSLANWHRPKAMRLYFWGNGNNYDRIIDIEKMVYQPY